ncbi:hypothetical protein MHL31_00195 [Lutibacter sp. A80]|uniref:hypothetical protein n=1 Tax=Lutibacter sp. A80 TaxID=2918453 RepID=UPI001F059A21|nr:hypothetical protein [Lutibacter sp. A80]UMB60647.1 hypothetical protein MHL31_00195 [Lutibacter sp. A80]
MSKEKLINIIAAPISELKKLKIGIMVRATLPLILKLELITDLEIERLQKSDYSKMTFDLNYPVLKKVDEKISIVENRTIGKYTRYYAKPQKNKNSHYLITSEWYDLNQEDYIRWLKRKVKTD